MLHKNGFILKLKVQSLTEFLTFYFSYIFYPLFYIFYCAFFNNKYICYVDYDICCGFFEYEVIGYDY